MRLTSTGRRPLGAVAVLTAVLLSACGASGTTGAGTPGSSAAASSARSAAAPGGLTFTGTTLDGASFDAASLAGKPTVLWFWAPWCPTCAAEAPDVLDVQSRYQGKVNVLGVAGLDDLKNMQPFVDRTGTSSVTHLGDPTGEIWRQFGVSQQSTYVLVDAAGQVTASGVMGGDELRAKVAALAG